MRPRAKNKKTGSLWPRASARGIRAFFGHRLTLGAFLPLVWPPLLALAVYAILYFARLFSPLYLALHVLAWGVALLWLVRAVRGATGYWAHGTHGRFALVFAALVAAGSCWGPWAAVDVRVWVTPPAYTARPTVQMAQGHSDILTGSMLHVGTKEEKQITVRWDGQTETLTPQNGEESTLSLSVERGDGARDATLLLHQGWHRLGLWRATIVPDAPPAIIWTEAPELTNRKTIRFAYQAWDDFGVESIKVLVTPITIAAGQPGGPVELPLATPRTLKAQGAGYADLTALPWSGQNVSLQLIAIDGAGQRTGSITKTMVLPTRKFRNPFARALIEEREKLLREPGAAMRSEAANVMAGIARQQGLFKTDAALYLALRAGAVRLVLDSEDIAITAASQVLWQAALHLEEGLMGQSREALARTQQDINEVLMRDADQATTTPLLTALTTAAQIYYRALESERAKQPESLREMNWLPVVGGEAVGFEDYRTRIEEIQHLLSDKKQDIALVRLGELQRLTENLRTAAPELSPSQDRLAQQVAALRALGRGQKQAMEETEKLESQPAKTYKEKQARGEALARALARQQALFSALQDVIEQFPDARAEIKDGVRAMSAAIAALHQQKPADARRQQAEAQALLENSVLILSEKMRQSLTASGP